MKNRVLTLVAAIVCGVIFTNCGGGNKGSGVKKNEYFGTLPSIYADYNVDKEAYKADLDKLREKITGTKDVEKLKKIAEEFQAREVAIEEKMEKDASAQIATLVGKEIPVSYSKALQDSGELFYNASAKLEASKKNYLLMIALSFTANKNLDVPTRKMGESGKTFWAYYRMIAADGSTITTGFCSDLIQQDTHGSSVAAGTALRTSDWNNRDLTYMMHEPEKYVNFAGIEFITVGEYEALPKK